MPRALSQRANQKPSRPALEDDCDTFDLASCFLRFLTPAIENLQQCALIDRELLQRLALHAQARCRQRASSTNSSKRSANASASSALQSRTPRTRCHRGAGVGERRRRQDAGSPKYHHSVHGVSHLFGRECRVMRELPNYPQSRPSALEIAPGGFAFGAGHRRYPTREAHWCQSHAAVAAAFRPPNAEASCR